MIYLDYSRKAGESIPNRYGGRENLDAIDFLQRLNELIEAEVPGAFTVAEESTAWPKVSRPVARVDLALRTSGTWGGCTTPSNTSSRTPFIGAITIINCRSACCTHSAKILFFRCRMTRSFTAKDR